MMTAERFVNFDTGMPQALANTIGSVFGGSGTNHSVGLVPDPGSASGLTRFLREDGTWSGALSTPATSGLGNVFSLSIGGENIAVIPFQIPPFEVPASVAGIMNDSSGAGIFQLASYVRNSGSSPTVGSFGQGVGDGASSSVWGGNFVGIANANGAVARGAELDMVVTAAGGASYGLVIGNVSTIGNQPGNYIQLNSNNGSANNGLVFNFDGIHQLLTGSLIKTNGAITATNGIDFTSATLSGNAFASNGFFVANDGTVNINSGSLVLNASQVSISGLFTTGTAAPVLTANKPGSSTSIGTWIRVIITGSTFWIPLWNN